jgi:Sigma-70 region 2
MAVPGEDEMTEAILTPAWSGPMTCPGVKRLYRPAVRLTRNAADAGDLVQETFAEVFAAHGQFQPGTT